jgi:predicted  nucleic acid-binding Zn-ribbon protein
MKNKTYDDSESSLKYFNFEGFSQEKIIEKYEVVLASREKQITDLSIEIGAINERLSNLSDKCKHLAEENEILKNKLQKKVILTYIYKK